MRAPERIPADLPGVSHRSRDTPDIFGRAILLPEKFGSRPRRAGGLIEGHPLHQPTVFDRFGHFISCGRCRFVGGFAALRRERGLQSFGFLKCVTVRQSAIAELL